MSEAILAVKNPEDSGTQATVVARVADLTPERVIADYADSIANGALVSITDQDAYGNPTGIWLYIADRESHDEGVLRLRSNGSVQHYVDLSDVGEILAEGEPPVPDEELETFTAYGVNDDDEPFTAVFAATEDGAHDAAVAAGLVDEGFEHSVTIVAIVKGDQSDLETV